MKQAVIFDMNGVIIDDEHVHEAAFRQVVEPFEVNLDHTHYLDLCAGKTDKAGIDGIITRFKLSVAAATLLRNKETVYLDLFPTQVKMFPGVKELIIHLHQYYRLALNSGSSRKEVDMVLAQFDLNQYFATTVAADDYTLSKPDPEPYVLTLKLLKSDPGRTVAIEDSISGIRSAQAAGVKCIATTTTHLTEDLQPADHVVDSFDQITPELIEQL